MKICNINLLNLKSNKIIYKEIIENDAFKGDVCVFVYRDSDNVVNVRVLSTFNKIPYI